MGRGHWVLAIVLLMSAAPMLGSFEVDEVPAPSPVQEVQAPFEDERPAMMLADLPGFFTENRGQKGEGAGLYYAIGDPLSVAFGEGWVAYVQSDEASSVMFRMNFVDANPVPPVGVGALGHRSNFFSGSDERDWVTGVRNYEEVVYGDLWDGIDLRFYFMEGMLKYDLLVAPGADPSTVSFRYEGVECINVRPSGDLEILTGVGSILEQAPYAFQDTDGAQEEVLCSFIIDGGMTLGFECHGYDPKELLVIDPGLAFGTYLGGSTDSYRSDTFSGMYVDGNGSFYLTGNTISNDFPTTPGVYDPSFDLNDGLVVKLKPDGSDIVFSTFIDDAGCQCSRNDVWVDDKGYMYIVGMVGTSGGLPVTPGAFDTTHNGGYDLFAMKMNPDGSRMIFCTYIGGSSGDSPGGIHVDDDGHIYIAATTVSSDFPTTNGAFCNSQPGNVDSVVIKVSDNGTFLEYSTYIGGSQTDSVYSICVNTLGEAYITGYTNSTDYPVTPDAYDKTLVSDKSTFVVQFNSTGGKLLYSSYYGTGSGGRDIYLDSNGDIYVAGTLYFGRSFPITPGTYQSTTKGDYDGYLMKLNGTTHGLEFSTLLGASGMDAPIGVFVPDSGNVYIFGATWSTDFPVTDDAFCGTFNGGASDYFIAVMDGLGQNLLYASYIGGSDWEVEYDNHVNRPMVDEAGCIYVAGGSMSTDWPTTTGAYSTSLSGNLDLVALKLDIDPPSIVNDTSPPNATTGDLYQFNLTVKDNLAVGNVTIEYWNEGANSSTFRRAEHTDGTLDNGTWLLNMSIPANATNMFYYRVHVNDSAGNLITSENRTIQVLDNDEPSISDASDTIATTGDPYQFRVHVTDNIDVDHIDVLYYFGNGTNVTGGDMVATNVTPEGFGTWVFNITVPSDSTEPLTYQFAARDSAINWNITTLRTINVTDNDRPLILGDGSDTTPTTGDDFRFAVNVSDNIGVESVVLTYWYGADTNVSEPMWLDEGEPNGNGRWMIDLVMSNVTDNLQYFYTVTDAAGNQNVTIIYELPMTDNDPPEFGKDLSDTVAVKGKEVTLTINVSDNIGVTGAYLVYWFLGGLPTNETLTSGPTLSYVLPVPQDPPGVLYYNFVAVDAAGNWMATMPAVLTPVNDPPRLEGVPTWQVTEGEEGTLDLSQYIVDANNDVMGITVVPRGAPNVSVTGLLLKALYVDWVADHVVEVSISDGEDTNYYNITVHVLNVNDPPFITSLPSETATVGEAYTYQVGFYDPDPDDVFAYGLIDPPTGMTVSPAGLVSWTPFATQVGGHTVNVSVSDGTVTVYQEWVVDVIASTTGEPYFTNTPPSTATAGELYSWTASAEDPDGDTLYFHLQTGPDGADVHQLSGLLTWTPVKDRKNTTADVAFGIYVTDGSNVVPMSFTVTVTYPPNQAPRIKGTVPDIDAKGRKQVQLDPYMEDPDDPVAGLTWSVEGGDDELFTATISGNTLTIEPKEGAKGSATLTLRLRDETGDEDTQTVSVTVTPKVTGGEDGETSWLPWLVLVVLIVVVAIALVVMSRRRGLEEEPDPEPVVEEPLVEVPVEKEPAPVEEDLDQLLEEIEASPSEGFVEPAVTAAAVPGAAFSPSTYMVEQVFVVYKDGRLVSECSREECRTRDADLMSGMLIAIQGLIQDGLESGGQLRSINYGDNIIRMVQGEHVVLAAVVYGTPDDALTDELESTVHRIEGSYAGVIEEWTGDLETLSGVKNLVNPLIFATAHLTREDVEALTAAEGVTVLSAIDFFRGYVRLKVAAVNGTDELMADASMEVLYNRDLLRLERVEPESLDLVGDRVRMCNVRPGERSTVAFMFDPQICQESHVDGTLTYYDVHGEVHRVAMKRRKADIVCPVFFTRENANTAMLRRLIKEKLHQSDLRVFRYPSTLGPEEVFKMGKSALGGDIQRVSEYVLEGPPYEAEVWYYGETRVKGFQMVMRVSVIESKGVLEFFVASTAMEPITGLIAECRRELDRVMMERTSSRKGMEVERDEEVRRDLERRPLLIDRQDEGEVEAGDIG
jgi:hypothetical protein